MSSPAPIAGLSEIADRFEAAVVDVWGVIHNGRTAYAPALEACRRFRAERGPVVLVSNAPRPSNRIPRQLERFGATPDFFDAIVTSGDATRAELAARAPGPAFKLGPPQDDRIYEGLGLDFAPLEDAAFISCTGPFDALEETPDDYAEMLAAAAARDLELICANPDIVVQYGDRLVYCAGALAEKYTALGGRAIYGGKPHAAIYALARTKIAEAAGREVASERIVAIGDGPDTDLAGAEAEGFASVFVASGIHAEETGAKGGLDVEKIGALLAAKGRRADWACARLAW
ncbi:MAG: TIGR01459 family HAD-type hydrolase [Maricaulaceae bacterium]|jgi:HAD superfamily hydrolase (TIGR01459 family)